MVDLTKFKKEKIPSKSCTCDAENRDIYCKLHGRHA